MAISEQDIREVTETVWGSTFELGVEPCFAPTRPTDPSRLVGRVNITGAWTGTVFVICSGDLARMAAAAIFGDTPGEATGTQASDALAEIINMTAGNLKALLPEPCQLGLPVVSEADAGDVGTLSQPRSLTEAAFTCQGQPFLVRVVGEPDA